MMNLKYLNQAYISQIFRARLTYILLVSMSDKDVTRNSPKSFYTGVKIDDSFKTHEHYLNQNIRTDKFKDTKTIELIEDNHFKKIPDQMGKIPHQEKKKVNFNLLEKSYFFIRRKLESKKRSSKNY